LRAAYHHPIRAHLEPAVDESVEGALSVPVTLAPERAG
jgi:hypothetical protein